MKITFICGTLEPGRDGVGDYIRRLAWQLISNSNKIIIIALYDWYVKEFVEENQIFEDKIIAVYRIPCNYSYKDRYNLLKNIIDCFDPHFISLQFVPFSFNQNGLPLKLISGLQKVGKGRNWHIMFHELWVARDYTAPLKQIILGNIQRYIIKFLIIKLRPLVIHTQTLLYKDNLNDLGFHASILPLFSNIPLCKSPKYQLEFADFKQKNKINFVVFGSIYPNSLFEVFTEELVSYSQKKMISISLTIIGGVGSERDHWYLVWKSNGFTLKVYDFQSDYLISELLIESDFGISTTPYPLIEKSGSVAAMREHGLPVICIAQPWQPNKTKNHIVDGISQYSLGNLNNCLTTPNTVSNENIINKVSEKIINEFKLFI